MSTFVGDNHSDLEEDNDDDLDWDASRLSFFHVPDFHSHGAGISAAGPGNSSRLPSDEHYFEARLNELSRISHSGNTALGVSSQDPPPCLQEESVVEANQEPHSTGQVRACDKNMVIVSPTADTTADRLPDMTQPFSDRRYQQLLPGNKLSTFSSPEGEKSLPPESPQNELCFQNPPLITGGGGAAIEEAHFLLSPPQQARTCPDGSSNPDIDLVPLPRRSPGSGKSQSDPEEEGKMAALSIVQQTIEKTNTSADPVIKKKEGSTFGTLLARLFGSAGSSSSSQNKKNQKKTTAGKRSKSCDKELESTSGAVVDRDGGGRQQHQPLQKSVKSASSSPMKTNRQLPAPAQGKRGSSWMQLTAGTAAGTAQRQEAVGATTPSTLSLDTEWEFQAQERHVGRHVHGEEEEDESNGNNVWEEQEPYSSLRYTAYISPGLTGDKRKSSGYDSLESCSLDSMDNGHNNSCQPAYYYDSRLLQQQQPQQQQVYGTYAVPELWINNGGNLNNASRELDEVTLLKLEIGRHPDILNKNY